jgi:phosphopantetheine--protein transferase-like protein
MTAAEAERALHALVARQCEALGPAGAGVGAVEIAGPGRAAARVATTLAAKEAVARLLGGAARAEIEIVRDRRGRPAVVLHGAARERARELGIRDVAVSLCHEAALGIAVAVATT